MRLTVLFLTVCLMSVHASVRSQSVTLTVKDLPLVNVFAQIEKQTGYVVFTAKEVLEGTRPVSLQVSHMPLYDFLQLALRDQPVKFRLDGNTIVLSRKTLSPPSSPAPALEEVTGGPVSGIVRTATGDPLTGVTVRVKGTAIGTTTNTGGYFRLESLPDNAVLHISYLGYDAVDVVLKKNGNNGTISTLNKAQAGSVKLIDATSLYFTVMLTPTQNPLDEVQVIAYGQTTQRYNVGSVVTVSAKQIEQQPVTNVLQALEGRVPGLLVTLTNGSPGAMTLTQIRGQNTLANSPDNAGQLISYNQPLYIIDGVPMAMQNNGPRQAGLAAAPGASYWQYYNGLSPLNSINPLDIESVSVLKDADATSIYGSQGSNGVILITTKKGKGGQHFSTSYNVGPTAATRTAKMMDQQQYLAMRHEALQNSNYTPSAAGGDADLLLFDTTKNTNWMKEFYGGTGIHSDLHSSLSGGMGNTNYLISVGYTRESYNFPGDFADNRLSLHSTFSHRSLNQKFSLDFGTDYSYDKNNSSGAPNVLSAFTLPPDYPDLLDANGHLVWSYKGYSLANGKGNPFAYLKQPVENRLYNLNTHLQLGYELMKGLKAVVNAGYSKVSTEMYGATPMASQDPSSGQLGSASFGNGYEEVVNIEPQLNYARNIGKGALNVIVGGTYRQDRMATTNTYAYNYTTDALLHSIAAAGGNNTTNDGSIYKYIAGFGRVNYIWDGKYIFNFTGNRNGSSNFGPDRRFGNFGSAGLGWIFTGEPFMARSQEVLSFGKLSGSYGTSGSDAVQPYQYQPNWGPVPVIGGYQGTPGFYPLNPLNPVYAWSTNKKLNLQMDLGFFKDRLNLNVTAYQDVSANQLVQYLQPVQTGFGSITANAPYTVKNKGLEISINSRNITHKNFQWSTNFNLSHNTNKLTKFNNLAGSPYAGTYILNQPVNIKTLVPYAGVNDTTGVYQYVTAKGAHTSSPQNQSGFNNVGGDATRLMDLNPKFIGGLNNTFTYKGISLSVFFQFAKQQGQNYRYSLYLDPYTAIPGMPTFNVPVQLLDRWQKPGDKSDMERLSAGLYTALDRSAMAAATSFKYSTGAYSDASYIRLKTVSLAYNLPAPLLKRATIQAANIFVNVQNLFTITGYKVGDPETQSLFSIPPQRTIVAGLNINF